MCINCKFLVIYACSRVFVSKVLSEWKNTREYAQDINQDDEYDACPQEYDNCTHILPLGFIPMCITENMIYSGRSTRRDDRFISQVTLEEFPEIHNNSKHQSV
jgi:hypothetical protein